MVYPGIDVVSGAMMNDISGGRRLGIQRTMLLDSLFGWEKDRASTSRQSVSLVVRDVLNDAIASCSSGVGLLA